MPSSTSHPHPSGRTITFTEHDHVYRDCTGRQYLSVSGFLKRFWPKFDAPAHAARIAAREQRSVESVLAQWDANRDRACNYGTRVHETAEAIFHGHPPPHIATDDRERNAFQEASICATTLRDHATRHSAHVMVERAVASIYYGIAGTADLLLVYPPSPDHPHGRIEIWDWKTNAQLTKAYENCPHPIAHIPASNLAKYELQLATYQAIIARDYYPPGQAPTISRHIIHIDHDGNRHIHNLPDRTAEVTAMLLAYCTGEPF